MLHNFKGFDGGTVANDSPVLPGTVAAVFLRRRVRATARRRSVIFPFSVVRSLPMRRAVLGAARRVFLEKD